MIVNKYAPNVSTINFIKHTLMNVKGHLAPKRIIVYDFTILLSPIDCTCRQKKSTKNLHLLTILEKMDLTNVYRIFHPTSVEYTFLAAH
jgi:hypothetical protein